MKLSRRRFALALMFGLVAGAVPRAAEPPAFDLDALIREADQMDLYSLQPDDSVVVDRHGNPAPAEGGAERFHGFPVLGKVAKLPKAEWAQLIPALLASLKPFPPPKEIAPGIFDATDLAPSFCFSPRHGLCLTQGDVHVDLVLCFQCGAVRVIRDSSPQFGAYQRSTEQRSLREDGREAFNAVLDQHKIKRDEEPKRARP